MIVFFFIFIVLPLLALSAVAAGLLALFTHFAVTTQEKRLDKSQRLSESEIREKAAAQVMWTYIALLVGFLLFLVMRYLVT